MYIDAQTIITAAAVLGAGSALLGALFAAYRWYQRQNKQDEDIKAMKKCAFYPTAFWLASGT